ncbi:hypothetical protein K402DRAFT_393464 [Aulographum hederae CBS 113979]|uniref:Secreted protein n=1 Tax=Aulographum hederae CBS 113979 TaxID=1176131 RepID=A0A6G1H0T9_9PEZI|nr:hypothetical protein K402DRAFT_393464 [Aulographum hederae CBS 113979]
MKSTILPFLLPLIPLTAAQCSILPISPSDPTPAPVADTCKCRCNSTADDTYQLWSDPSFGDPAANPPMPMFKCISWKPDQRHDVANGIQKQYGPVGFAFNDTGKQAPDSPDTVPTYCAVDGQGNTVWGQEMLPDIAALRPSASPAP